MIKFGAAFLAILFLAALWAAAEPRRAQAVRHLAAGVVANERLTALSGLPLFALLAAAALTVLFIRQLLPEHYLVGGPA